MRKLALAAFASFLLFAVPAWADIIMVDKNIGSLDTENILLNLSNVDPKIIVGETNQTHTLVDFIGQENLLDPPQGQAVIVAADGGYTNLMIKLDPANPGNFTNLVFNLNASANGEVTFEAFQPGGGSVSQTFDLKQSGSNYFSIYAINGQQISYVTLATTVDLQNMKDPRIGFTAQPGPTIPEPGTILLLGSGLATLGVALIVRKRRN